MKVFLDANVIFSAAQTGSLARLLVESVATHVQVVVHPVVWEEAARNLHMKRPAWVAGLEELRSMTTLSAALSKCPSGLLPSKDEPVLGAAIAAHCDYLVTGDRTHFGALYGHTVHGVMIVSPRQFAEQMRARGWLG